jgi:EAL domain-containing protein (putative c-di-GMP-specific phosphodiesterase class I)
MKNGKTLNGADALKNGVAQPFPFTMAFQPIVDVDADCVYAYEALVRGPRNEPAHTVLLQVNDQNRFAFDQTSRVNAIVLATGLGILDTGARLSINFMANASRDAGACIQLTLETAAGLGFPCERLIFEIVESEEVLEPGHLRATIEDYRRRGFKIAIDDFGSGHSGLKLLAEFPPDVIKLDIALTRKLHERNAALAIVKAMVPLAKTLGCDLIAEGVEAIEEYEALCDCGISLMQGFLFARPAFETLPDFKLPNRKAA